MIFYLIIFVVGGLGGWIMDTAFRTWCAKTYTPNTWLPFFSIIYGSATVMLYHLFTFSTFSIVAQIIVGLIIAICLEFISGIIALTFLKRRFWDYRSSKYNLYGFVDAEHCFYWLVLVALFRLIYPILF